MANIRDIARITGYSVATVSRVINQHPYVAENKRQEILAVMRELNYVPNLTAQNLSHGKTHNLGVIIPYNDHPYFDQLINGILSAAFEADYQVTLLPTNYRPEKEQAYLEEFAAKAFDGLIITSRSNSLPVLLEYAKKGRVVFCEYIPDKDISCTYIDRENSLREALLTLKEQGVNKLGVTLGRSRNLSYNSRITLQLAKEIFPTFSEEWVCWDALTAAAGKRAGDFFAEGAVDGILANTDLVAAGIVADRPAYRQTVIGRDNLFLSEVLGFSTIDNHLADCGRQAFELFLQAQPAKIKVPYKFIKRN